MEISFLVELIKQIKFLLKINYLKFYNSMFDLIMKNIIHYFLQYDSYATNFSFANLNMKKEKKMN